MSLKAVSKERLLELFGELAAGRREALAELYDLATRELFGLALWRTGSTEDASEVVQDVFVRLAQQGKKLLTVKDPKAWLLTVTHRAAIDLTRRRRRRQAQPLDEVDFLAAPTPPSERHLDAERVSALLTRLPVAQRDAIFLHHFADCTFRTIGNITGVSTFTAASRYRLGIKKMRTFLERQS